MLTGISACSPRAAMFRSRRRFGLVSTNQQRQVFIPESLVQLGLDIDADLAFGALQRRLLQLLLAFGAVARKAATVRPPIIDTSQFSVRFGRQIHTRTGSALALA